jgi:hypothetical protein
VSETFYREHDNRAPALIAAVLLHAGVFALIVLVPTGAPLLPIGSSVPINIVSSDPFTNTRPAVEAPQTEAAQTPTPVPAAPPQPAAPPVAPPVFSAEPKPKAAHDKPVPAQASLHPSKPSASAPDLISHLQSIIDNARRNSGQSNSSAQKGPARPQTAPQAKPDAGQGDFQSNMLGLTQLLERLWNPNCDVPGGDSVRLTAKFSLGADGRVSDGPHVGGLESSDNGVVAAAARRAIDAVREAEPYAQPFRGQTIVVNFNAKEACAKR